MAPADAVLDGLNQRNGANMLATDTFPDDKRPIWPWVVGLLGLPATVVGLGFLSLYGSMSSDGSQLPELARRPVIEGLPGWQLRDEKRAPHSDFAGTRHASVTRTWLVRGNDAEAASRAYRSRYGVRAREGHVDCIPALGSGPLTRTTR